MLLLHPISIGLTDNSNFNKYSNNLWNIYKFGVHYISRGKIYPFTPMPCLGTSLQDHSPRGLFAFFSFWREWGGCVGRSQRWDYFAKWVLKTQFTILNYHFVADVHIKWRDHVADLWSLSSLCHELRLLKPNHVRIHQSKFQEGEIENRWKTWNLYFILL